MKLKAVLHLGCAQELVEVLESTSFRERVIDKVLDPHLHVGDLGPAEFYIQACDFAVGGSEPMCEVRLTGVSGVTMSRSAQDFLDARDALESLYQEIIEKHIEKVLWPSGQLQLMVSIMLDQKPELLPSALIERHGNPAIWIKRTVVQSRGI